MYNWFKYNYNNCTYEIYFNTKNKNFNNLFSIQIISEITHDDHVIVHY